MFALLARIPLPSLLGLGLLVVLPLLPCSAEEPAAWSFRDGDRIVSVGDTLIERDQRYGYLETMLTIANPELNLTFRNLGWSGDTVRGLSRAGFDPPEAGFRELVKQVLAAKPTVLIVGYGMADSFDGEAGLPRFESGLNQFLDAVASTNARLVLLSPIPHEEKPTTPDDAAHNRSLLLYAEAVRKVADERKARSIEVLHLIEPRQRETGLRVTDNGIHLTEFGYQIFGRMVARRLGRERTDSAEPVSIRADGKVLEAGQRNITDVEATSRGLRFTIRDHRLTMPGADGRAPQISVSGLKAGTYGLKVDGKAVAKATAEEWARGIELRAGPEQEQVERLRRTINEKNLLFFHRWRPQNQTYLFGFRKHEQGNNAIEVPQFDPLVEAKERKIARLRKPVPHLYELIREGEVAR